MAEIEKHSSPSLEISAAKDELLSNLEQLSDTENRFQYLWSDSDKVYFAMRVNKDDSGHEVEIVRSLLNYEETQQRLRKGENIPFVHFTMKYNMPNKILRSMNISTRISYATAHTDYTYITDPNDHSSLDEIKQLENITGLNEMLENYIRHTKDIDQKISEYDSVA